MVAGIAGKGSGRQWSCGKEPGKESFKAATLNILSPVLLSKHPEIYSPLDLKAGSEWESRRRRCVEELRSYEAEVVCLQELEAGDAVPFAKGLDLELATFAACGGESRTDGCAIYFDKQRFAVAQAEALILDAGASKVNAAAVAVLDLVGERDSLVVATAHLLFNPKRGDLRLRQAQSLTEVVAALARDHADRRSRRVGTMVLGDLNSTPESSVYEFLANGRVSRHRDKKKQPFIRGEHPHVPGIGHGGHGTSLLGPPPPDKQLDKGDCLANAIDDLASAYAQPHPRLPPGCPGEPPFTTYINKGTKGTVDYLFFGTRHLKLQRRLHPPGVLHLRRGLRANVSDHVALVAAFRFASATFR